MTKKPKTSILLKNQIDRYSDKRIYDKDIELILDYQNHLKLRLVKELNIMKLNSLELKTNQKRKRYGKVIEFFFRYSIDNPLIHQYHDIVKLRYKQQLEIFNEHLPLTITLNKKEITVEPYFIKKQSFEELEDRFNFIKRVLIKNKLIKPRDLYKQTLDEKKNYKIIIENINKMDYDFEKPHVSQLIKINEKLKKVLFKDKFEIAINKEENKAIESLIKKYKSSITNETNKILAKSPHLNFDDIYLDVLCCFKQAIEYFDVTKVDVNRFRLNVLFQLYIRAFLVANTKQNKTILQNEKTELNTQIEEFLEEHETLDRKVNKIKNNIPDWDIIYSPNISISEKIEKKLKDVYKKIKFDFKDSSLFINTKTITKDNISKNIAEIIVERFNQSNEISKGDIVNTKEGSGKVIYINQVKKYELEEHKKNMRIMDNKKIIKHSIKKDTDKFGNKFHANIENKMNAVKLYAVQLDGQTDVKFFKDREISVNSSYMNMLTNLFPENKINYYNVQPYDKFEVEI